MFEDGLLRMVPHGTKPHEVLRKWRQLQSEQPHNLHSLPNSTETASSTKLTEKRPIAQVRFETQNSFT